MTSASETDAPGEERSSRAPSAAVPGTKRNLIFLTGASTLQMAIQFLIQVVLAYLYGARAEADALAAALVIPTLLSAIIGGSLSYVLVPELVACFASQEKRELGWRLAGIFGLVTSLLAIAATLAVLSSSADIVQWLYGKLAEDQRGTAVHLLALLSWQVPLSTLIGWSLAIHHSRHSFIVPASGGVMGTSVTLLMTMWLGHRGIDWIAMSINVGSLVSALIHVAPIVPNLRLGSVPREKFARLLWALLPLVVGSIYLRIDPVVDRSLASRLEEGSVAHLHYAQRIIMALLAISTSGLSVVAFPQLAGRLANEGHDGFVSHFALAMRRLVLIVAPIAIGLSWFAVPVIADLLQRGQFTAEDARVVGSLIVCFMGMFVGASSSELLARGFYTLGDTRTPTIVGVITLTIGLAAKWFSLPYLEVWGIALSTSLAFMLTSIIMSVVLARRTRTAIFAGCGRTLALATMAALVACCVCTILYTGSLLPGGTVVEAGVGRTWLAAPIGAIVYGVIVWRMGEWRG